MVRHLRWKNNSSRTRWCVLKVNFYMVCMLGLGFKRSSACFHNYGMNKQSLTIMPVADELLIKSVIWIADEFLHLPIGNPFLSTCACWTVKGSHFKDCLRSKLIAIWVPNMPVSTYHRTNRRVIGFPRTGFDDRVKAQKRRNRPLYQHFRSWVQKFLASEIPSIY